MSIEICLLHLKPDKKFVRRKLIKHNWYIYIRIRELGKAHCEVCLSFLSYFRQNFDGTLGFHAILQHLNLYRDAFLYFLNVTDDADLPSHLAVE